MRGWAPAERTSSPRRNGDPRAECASVLKAVDTLSCPCPGSALSRKDRHSLGQRRGTVGLCCKGFGAWAGVEAGVGVRRTPVSQDWWARGSLCDSSLCPITQTDVQGTGCDSETSGSLQHRAAWPGPMTAKPRSLLPGKAWCERIQGKAQYRANVHASGWSGTREPSSCFLCLPHWTSVFCSGTLGSGIMAPGGLFHLQAHPAVTELLSICSDTAGALPQTPFCGAAVQGKGSAMRPTMHSHGTLPPQVLFCS